ncbi:hypothetical protein CYLTODRAFT_380020 [Cylindrobasidium torrendii FP15055 ss-10]|uniref:Uncharacterized protein n=1 Tax=Cylindrobasidium torrendii FP15055 ss-10 TaxID=1314674 RepID=A0A0D7B360_9AGAR|nr:hypothetical protein CYLTODRAFT_380020 [Cylindrobasidium torrendii FP15055 ss-10]
MDPTVSIKLDVRPAGPDRAQEFLVKDAPKESELRPESSLLKEIREALRGAPSMSDPRAAENQIREYREADVALIWNDTRVVQTVGGVIRRQWDFSLEKQKVEYACTGLLQHIVPEVQLGGHDYTFPATSVPSTEDKKSTFGPFAQSSQPSGYSETVVLERTVFIFLRRIGMAFMDNGIQHTFSVPFVVRAAFPVAPFGVLLQRSLDPHEYLDADENDPVLPTIFTLSHPLAEISPLGVTGGIHGEPPQLIDEEKLCKSPLPTIPFDEWVVWTSFTEPMQLMVTVQQDGTHYNVWQYQHIEPISAPQPLPRERIRERARKRQSLAPRDFPLPAEAAPISLLPDMPPALTGTASLQSLMTQPPQLQLPSLNDTDAASPGSPRRNRGNSLSDSLDRMKMDDDISYLPVENGRMKTSFWAHKLYTAEIPGADRTPDTKHRAEAALFDDRVSREGESALLAICLGSGQTALLSMTRGANHALVVKLHSSIPAISIGRCWATRSGVADLITIDTNNEVVISTIGGHLIKLDIPWKHDSSAMDVDDRPTPRFTKVKVIEKEEILLTGPNVRLRARISLRPRTRLGSQCMQIISLCLTTEIFVRLQQIFLTNWSQKGFVSSGDVEFHAFAAAICTLCGIAPAPAPRPKTPWESLAYSDTAKRFEGDIALRASGLQLPTRSGDSEGLPSLRSDGRTLPLLAPILYALHLLAEDMRFAVDRYQDLRKLVGLICPFAAWVRPEWADYWRRLIPSAVDSNIWPMRPPAQKPTFDDRIPVWPPDVSAILYGRISNPEWQVPSFSIADLSARFAVKPSFAYGGEEPLEEIRHLTEVYRVLSDPRMATTSKRAEYAVRLIMARSGKVATMLEYLPLGIAAPLREAIRSCQLHPPLLWSFRLYKAIGRNDVAASSMEHPAPLGLRDGYRTIKESIDSKEQRSAMSTLLFDAYVQATGDIERMSSVERDAEEFAKVRFGTDRRLEDVARMLDSSRIQTYKQLQVERAEPLSEPDQQKEYQHQALRVAERTIALTHGRSMFTFGAVLQVNRESYSIPPMCYSIKIHPNNISVSLEMKLLPPDSITWGEFHNGVAAGLRIGSTALGVDSSWISFNKPGELSAAHAGVLFGLGLNGHLKQMVAWNTFQYLTPKHDLTSIGVLLGLAASHVGSGNRKVTKLLAVHTPALLPTPSVDLNISLITQSAGLIGMGLLYMGTKHRRYADVCLREIRRRDLVEPTLQNEYRETYTTCAALGFGLIMLGKGSTIPADIDMVERLTVLIHGENPNNITPGRRPTFDLTLTSPAATIALGLMYLRTSRQDIADILALPDTVVGLNRVQPSFLLLRVLARSLIMWADITPTAAWLDAQIPAAIRAAVETRHKMGAAADDALELAYYNIIAGCCFVVGLKYAGTARQEAYKLIIRFYDIFTRLVYSNGPSFDNRIRRSAVRDGLNLICIALSMVMAGTGEITSFRRLRYAYGMFSQTMYHPSHKFGIHVSTYHAIGMLFLGGGRYTLGTSDAAIAGMVMAFFPRYHHISADNKVYLQALRHMWVLAVEPRCLVARDVTTNEVVYLPLKLIFKEGPAQLISPTLIPEMSLIKAVRVDVPRYWPFTLDLENLPSHRRALIKNQTIFVKRRTAFLSYTEDPRGSRSLFVRSQASAGEAAILDNPQIQDEGSHPASDLSEFITSFSNDPIYLAFAEHFVDQPGANDDERLFFTYCHAALYDAILQGKQESLQGHLSLYQYRTMKMDDPHFQLRLQDLRFATDFYSKIFDRRFSGRAENNPRTPLMRDSTLVSALCALDAQLDAVRVDPEFMRLLARYTAGLEVQLGPGDATKMAWYLVRNAVPVSMLLGVIKGLAQKAYAQCYPGTLPAGTMDSPGLDRGIKEVLHHTGSKMTTAMGSGWSVRSLDEIVELWKMEQNPASGSV